MRRINYKHLQSDGMKHLQSDGMTYEWSEGFELLPTYWPQRSQFSYKRKLNLRHTKNGRKVVNQNNIECVKNIWPNAVTVQCTESAD